MIPCKVRTEATAVIVEFDDGREIDFQSDWDQVDFAVRCGLIVPPDDWDGRPSTLPGWEDADLTDITECPEEYLPEEG